MATIDLTDGATLAQIHEAERIQARKGRCIARLENYPRGGHDGRVLLHVDVIGDKPVRVVAGRPLAYMTITLLPSGRPCDVTLHDTDVSMKALDEAVLAEVSTARERWWSAPEIAEALGVDYDRVRASLTRLIGLQMLQFHGETQRRRYRHAEAWC